MKRTTESESSRNSSAGPVALTLAGRSSSLGNGTNLYRLLPSHRQRSVGPFVFFDHFGPTPIGPDGGLDVRPHPHINLATVTYLFEGAVLHRDSLACEQTILPGAVNWMTAGRGIVHSERTPDSARKPGVRLHGVQAWVALPVEHEEVEPAFHHHPAADIPEGQEGEVRLRVLAGEAFGLRSPVQTFSPTVYAELQLTAGARITLPAAAPERAIYPAQGKVRCGGQETEPGRMLILTEGAEPTLEAESDARVMLLGGAPLDGPRHMYWNFVSSRRERIEQAKADWQNGRFDQVPGDTEEFIPLPEA